MLQRTGMAPLPRGLVLTLWSIKRLLLPTPAQLIKLLPRFVTLFVSDIQSNSHKLWVRSKGQVTASESVPDKQIIRPAGESKIIRLQESYRVCPNNFRLFSEWLIFLDIMAEIATTEKWLQINPEM